MFDTGGEYREDLMTDKRNNCWKGSKADYVIVCDMDEFLYADNLLENLVLAKQQNVVFPVVVGYNMMSDTFTRNYDLPLPAQVRHGFKDRMFDKNIIFNPQKVVEINFSPGSHHCMPIFSERPIKDPLVEFKLLHFKYLEKEYLYKKHQHISDRMSEVNKKHRYGEEYLLGANHIDSVYRLSSYLIEVVKEME